jgi:hypothetical protein
MSISLKIALDEQVRRISVAPTTTLSALHATVRTLFHRSANDAISLKYVDEDGDWISVGSDAELLEAFSQAQPQSSGTLKLVVSLSAAKAPAARDSLLSSIQAGAVLKPVPTPVVVAKPAQNDLVSALESAMSKRRVDVVDNNDDDDDDDEEFSVEEVPVKEDEGKLDRNGLLEFFKELGAKLSSEGAKAAAPVAAQLKTAINELLNAGVVARDQLAPMYAALAASPKELQELVTKMIELVKQQHATLAAFGGMAALDAVHAAICDQCKAQIRGVRFKCAVCDDFDLCAVCFQKHNTVGRLHDAEHLFLTIVAPLHGSPALLVDQRAAVAQQPEPAVAAAVAAAPARAPLSAHFVRHETLPDGSTLLPKTSFVKIWTVQNSGASAWPAGCRLVTVGGDALSVDIESDPLPPVLPGTEIAVMLDAKAPSAVGSFTQFFRMADAHGTVFGERLWISINTQIPRDAHEDAAPVEPELPEPARMVDESIMSIIERSFENIENAFHEVVGDAPPVQQGVAPVAPVAQVDVVAPVQQGVAPPAQPDEMFASQRKQLLAMGFSSNRLSELLRVHEGNVVAVCQDLLEHDE